jgi:hypothetical protein
MCYPKGCKACGKTTWAGCGNHVSQVMRSVPKENRCRCTPEERAAANRGLFGRLFSR